MTMSMASPVPVQVEVERGVGAKPTRGCPKRGARLSTRFRRVATLPRLSTRPAAGGRRLTLNLRLSPGVYRLTLRANLDGNRLSPPVRSGALIVVG
jgi:hypothetical protein